MALHNTIASHTKRLVSHAANSNQASDASKQATKKRMWNHPSASDDKDGVHNAQRHCGSIRAACFGCGSGFACLKGGDAKAPQLGPLCVHPDLGGPTPGRGERDAPCEQPSRGVSSRSTIFRAERAATNCSQRITSCMLRQSNRSLYGIPGWFPN